MILFEKNGHTTYISPLKYKVRDVVGAGDTVVSVLSLALASGFPIIEAAHLANIAAGIVVSKPETAVIKIKELVDFINFGNRQLFYTG